jgi:hypothetical protein
MSEGERELELIVSDWKYRVLMLQLSRMFTSKDKEELQYLLASKIPDGKMESLDTPLKVFRCLEKLDSIGPNNLCGLEQLFRVMEKHELSAMIRRFIEENRPNSLSEKQTY